MSDAPDESRLISAFEQQVGTSSSEGLAQQQAAPPEISAEIEHAGAAWTIGWATTNAAKKQTRMRRAI